MPRAGDGSGQPAEQDAVVETATRLWPRPAEVRVVRTPRPPAHDEADWLVLPSMRRPWLLVPAWNPTAADALVRHDDGQRSPRLVRALAVLQRQRALGRTPLPRLRVARRAEADTIEHELASVLGAQSDLVIRLGRRRWNRSVVLRPLDETGRTRAFVKAASTRAAAEALRVERDNLARVAALGPRSVEWPQVLHDGTWRDFDLLALSPLFGVMPPRTRGRAPTAAMRALALSGDQGELALAETDLCRRLTADAQALAESAQRAQLMASIDVIVSRLGQVPLPVGCWHGDWVPWNMTRNGERVLLWDWEHFAEGVPVGFDGIHYRAQQLRMLQGTDRSAEDQWVRDCAAWLLSTFQLSPRQIQTTLLAYLLEINLRYLRDREPDPRDTPPRPGWGLPMIGRLTAEID